MPQIPEIKAPDEEKMELGEKLLKQYKGDEWKHIPKSAHDVVEETKAILKFVQKYVKKDNAPEDKQQQPDKKELGGRGGR